MIVYFYLVVIVIFWTLNPFIKKSVMKKLTSEEYFFVNHMVVTFFVLLFFLYSYSKKKITKNCLTHLNSFTNKELSILFIGGFITVLSSRLLPYLIELKKDVSYLISHIQPVVIVLTALVGFAFFQEKLNKPKILGIILVGMGLFFINK